MRDVLFDPETGEEFSANAGDYFFMSQDAILDRPNGTHLWLKRNGVVVKKVVRKRDLKDEIYEAQAKQRKLLRGRKSVSNQLFYMRMNDGKQYVLDGKGRMTQKYSFANRDSFSDQWLLYGVTMRWNARPVENWAAVLKNPKAFIGGYVYDRDNGTLRGWGGNPVPRIRALYPDDSLKQEEKP